MSSTSRVLRDDELHSVAPVWWREKMASAPMVIQPTASTPEALVARLDTEASEDLAREAYQREAYQRGFAEGIAAGKEQSAADVQAALERMSQTLTEIATLKSRLRREAEKDLLKLAIAVARRVLHREVTIDPESIEGLIKVALDKLQSRDVCRVRTHPSHAPFMKASFDRLSGAQKIELIADQSLRPGDVLFETTQGTLDASIETQLSEIERGFADRLQRYKRHA